MTRVLLVIALLAVLAGCVSLVMLANAAGSSAVDKALAAGADDDQRVTAVCVGLNIGSCRTTQESTAARPAGDDAGGIPWPVKLLAVALGCPLLLGAVIWLWGRSAEV